MNNNLHGHPLARDADGAREALDLADVGVGDVVAALLLHLGAGRLQLTHVLVCKVDMLHNLCAIGCVNTAFSQPLDTSLNSRNPYPLCLSFIRLVGERKDIENFIRILQ